MFAHTTTITPKAIRRVLAGALAGSALAVGAAWATAPAADAAPRATSTQTATIMHSADKATPHDILASGCNVLYECVFGDNVHYRSGPGTDYRVLGTVTAGQPVTKHCWAPGSGSGWFKVDIWGQASNVWIAEQNVDHIHSVPNC